MSEYDPLSQISKHIMLRNGLFDFDDIPNGECLCGHSESEHLIGLEGVADLCLYAKGKDNICICDKFVDEGCKIVIHKLEKKLPKKEMAQTLENDSRLNSYIQTLARV